MPQRRELRGGQDHGAPERKTLATACAVAADSSRLRKDEPIRAREHRESRHRRLECLGRLHLCPRGGCDLKARIEWSFGGLLLDGLRSNAIVLSDSEAAPAPAVPIRL